MKLLLTLLCALMMTDGLRANPEKRIDSLLNYYAQTLQFNGVAFVSVKGQTLLNKGYGYKDREGNTVNDPNTVFQIGSITKQFTAEVILMLAKEGKIGLQDKLVRYFPGYPSGDRITIEQLLTHTSGIYNYTDDTLWARHPGAVVSKERMLAIFRDKPLEFSPGSKFEYSNSNYLLLGYIIAQVSGKPYEAVVRERIFQPLGMTQSGFDFMHLASADKATGYNCVLIDSFHRDRLVDSTQCSAAGAMYSTAADLYKWHRALQSYSLLEKSWQQKAYVPHKDGYGYGWMIRDSVSGKKVYVHSGGINGFSSYLLRVEQEDLCIVLLSNVEFGGSSNNLMAKCILKCLYEPGFYPPAPRTEIALPDRSLQRYEGIYTFAVDSTVNIRLKLDRSRMLFKLGDQPEDRMYPQSETMFFSRSADAQFEFIPDGQRGYKLLVHQHGQQFEAKRSAGRAAQD